MTTRFINSGGIEPSGSAASWSISYRSMNGTASAWSSLPRTRAMCGLRAYQVGGTFAGQPQDRSAEQPLILGEQQRQQ
jgi:hypothetical protein